MLSVLSSQVLRICEGKVQRPLGTLFQHLTLLTVKDTDILETLRLTSVLAHPHCFSILVIQVSEYQNGLFLNSEEVSTNSPMPLCTPGQSPIESCQDTQINQSPKLQFYFLSHLFLSEVKTL